ncbi:MAG: S53 family peptidase [Burkholderiaceae bacterium]|nr:S53 family peptidase [Burkholderiaceae bacterium]
MKKTLRTIAFCAIGAALTVDSTFAAAFHSAASVSTPANVAQEGKQLEFEVILPLTHESELDQLLAQQQDQTSSNFHHWLSPDEFKSRFGANPDSVARVKQFLQSNGLTIVKEHAQGVRVRGETTAAAAALGLKLETHVDERGVKRLIASPRQNLRQELRNEGAMITAFAPLPHKHVHSVNVGPVSDGPQQPGASRNGTNYRYYYNDLKEAYDFPSYLALNGMGVHVAIVMSSDMLDSDVTAAFNYQHWTSTTHLAPPAVKRVFVDGTSSGYFTGAFDEASLDTQQVTGMAPAATTTLVVIPDLSDQSIMDGYMNIIDLNSADVVSSSFGGGEWWYEPAYNQGTDYTYVMAEYNQIFKQGNAQGITFVASSGDEGGIPAVPVNWGLYYGGYTGEPATAGTYVPGVEYPAASPYVTGVGGTNLVTTSPGVNSAYISESAFGDPLLSTFCSFGDPCNITGGYWGSGGGESIYNAKPFYQSSINTGSTMRTVPDVSMMMGGCPGGISQLPCAPGESYIVIFDGGSRVGLIGTSVSAPDFAGAVALWVQSNGHRLGNINNSLYSKAYAQAYSGGPRVFHSGIPGYNGWESGGGVYNRVVGVGTPDVRALIGGPASRTSPAGAPQTLSNP